MTAVINFDTQTDEQRHNFRQLLEIARRLKLSFQIQSENKIWENVSDWSDVSDVEFSKFAIAQLVDDWDCPEEWAH